MVVNTNAQTRPDINSWVLESIQEMPSKGGYKLTSASAKSLRDSFSWSTRDSQSLIFSPKNAVPSYCTTATYLIFYRVLEKYWKWSRTKPSVETFSLLKPNLEADGLRIWGRWNSNGPGTAKLFKDAQLGRNFDDVTQARPGDFLKIFWNDEVGKNERGHTVIFLESFKLGNETMIRFWGSSASTSGYGVKVVSRSEYSRLLFSRLENPENISQITFISELDSYLASMLTTVSSWPELRQVSGIDSY